MYKYDLYEIDTFSGVEKLVAKSNDLEKLRKYAMENYCNNDDPEYDKELEDDYKNRLYYYSNRSGQYHGSGYEPHAVIVVNEDYFVIIE